MYNVYRGRLKHGRHFTFKSFAGDVAITFVCAGVQGAFADERHLYAAHGPWLQVFLRPEFFDLFLEDVESFLNAKKVGSHFHCHPQARRGGGGGEEERVGMRLWYTRLTEPILTNDLLPRFLPCSSACPTHWSGQPRD